LTGIASTETPVGAREAILSDYLISCRVMGRGVEEAMLHAAVELARSSKALKLIAHHLPTPRNAPCLQFFREKSRFHAEGDGHTFVWDARESYPLPAHVRLEMK